MLTRDFDYLLPPEAIAQQPAPRGESRLLVLDAAGAARHRRIADLPALLRRGDLLVVNDTRVLPARLFGHMVERDAGSRAARRAAEQAGQPPGGAGGAGEAGEEDAREPAHAGGPRVELLLVERAPEGGGGGGGGGGGAGEDGSDTGAGASAGTGREWDVLARPGRRARPGAVIEIETPEGSGSGIHVEVLELLGDGRRRVRFSEPIEPHLERLGHVPLPPYIHRPDEPADRERYQTVYASNPGAIAAPTAGLHFSERLLADLAAAGVERAVVTLHVGIGTFKPVTAPLVSDHRMERERFEIPEATAAAVAGARADGRRVVAVGTTVVRALEAAATPAAAAGAAGSEVRPGAGSTDLFIVPGFRFQVVDVLLTNFHLPRSTLLMLVSAFAGQERVLAVYEEALRMGYRFFSYGDAMLAERCQEPT